LFFWIKFEILKIFFDLWFCVFAQRTRRQNDVVWIVSFLKIFLNSNFFFLTMIFFLTSMNFKYVFQLFSIRRNDHSLRFLLIVVTTFEHLEFQKNCVRSDFLIMKIASWMIDCKLNRIFLTKVSISLTLLKNVETTKTRKQNVSFSLSIFFQALLFLINVCSIFSVKIVNIDIWFDDWSKSRLLSQCVMLACSRSIMKIKSMMLFEFFAFHVTIFWDRHKFICLLTSKSINWLIAVCWIERIESFYKKWWRLKFFKKRALRRSSIEFASSQWWTKMRLTRKTLKRHCIRYECWRYADHLIWALMCTCLKKRNQSISCWRSILCWYKSTFERFFSFHTKNENRLRTNCTTSKCRRYVKVFESSIYRIFWFENLLIKKSWFRSCCFSHCIVILREWSFLSFFWISRALRVRIALMIAWCRLVEWSFQTRRRFEFVSKQNKNVNSFLRRIDLYHADEASAKSRRFVDEILIATSLVNDRWQSEKTIRNFIEI
jgi:hypothetical protein